MLMTRFSLLLALLAGFTSATASESKLTLLPPVAAVAVQPAVAPPGTPRKIVVAGMWPTACVPTGAQIGFPPTWARNAGVGILLAEPLTFAPCAQALTAYRFELDYTPERAGQAPILVMTSQGSPLATGTLVSGDEVSPMALYDVGGSWFDPQTPGSGLQVTHDYGQTDAIFATWAVFDPATGAPRWYALQQGRWDADGLAWRGLLFEVDGAPSACVAPCSSPFARVALLGMVRLSFAVSYVHGGLDGALDLLQEGAPPRRLSNLVRFVPHRIVIQ